MNGELSTDQDTMSSQSLLDQLRQHSSVDCDTLDVSVAQGLKPFVDCTSNQAIAYLELSKPGHANLILESIKLAREHHLAASYPNIPWQSLAVEICTIRLACCIAPHLTGKVHVQVNPAYAYSTAETITAAQRIVSLFSREGLSADRVCIKIPSTWEGLLACKALHEQQINTLATTLFTVDQAIVAAQMQATYIAPYVNELAVHFEPGFVDQFPGHDVSFWAKTYYLEHGYATKVLPASLISVEECVALVAAGVDHITIAPALLLEMSKLPSRSNLKNARTEASLAAAKASVSKVGQMDEPTFRMALTRRDGGRGEIKQIKAINVFAGFQEKLEALINETFEASK